MCLLFALCCAGLANATVLDPAWTETVAGTNTNTPGDETLKFHTGIAWAPDGSDRLFVLEKNGRVRLMKGFTTTGAPVWSTFATMSPIVTTSECGLLGLTFDPNFAVNKLVYFFVTSTANTQEIIRYDASGDIGTDRTVIVTPLPTLGANNDGGGIAFGPDGKLYFSVGDLGVGVGINADLNSLASKVGRANRNGTVPSDNPFVDGAGPNNDLIFARGFRNPFSMTFQPATGRLWLNVAGVQQEQVFMVGVAEHGGWNLYENDQPTAGFFIRPVITYRDNGVNVRTLSSASRTGNVATFTTSSAHRFRQGENITVAGVSESSFNGTVYVASGSGSTFSAIQVGPNGFGTGGTATTLDQGSSVTGGAFYDATAAPAAYRGNFFYGDFVSNRIMRATIDSGFNSVRTVDYWATNSSGQVDIAVGPDAALYYTGFGTNNVYRAAYNAQAQGIVVSSQNLQVEEGRSSMLTVRLALAPAGPVTVAAARASGDSDITVAGGASLDFNASNWSIPQVVTIAAGADVDEFGDEAIVSLSSSGLTTIAVAVHGLDDNSVPLPDLLVDGFESP